MAYSLKKMWTAMAVTLTAATSLVNAATYSNVPPSDPFNGGYHGGYDGYDAYGCQNPCCPPVNNCGSSCNFYIDGEALFWRACEDGLAYVTETCVEVNPTCCEEIGAFTEIHNPSFRWDVGFRVGVGANIACCDCWDASAYWTHFETTARAHQDDCCDNEGCFFEPTFGARFFGPEFDTFEGPSSFVHAHYRLRLDFADFDLGREFCVSPCLSLRPYFGVRAAWVKQHFRIRSVKDRQFVITNGPDSGTIGIAVTNREEIKLKSDFDGAGLRTGLGSEWNVGCGFSIYADAALNIILGRYENRSFEDAHFFNVRDGEDEATEHTFGLGLKDHFCACRAIADAAAGIRWAQTFCCDTVRVVFQFGWEQHLFFDKNKFDDFTFSSAEVRNEVDAAIVDGRSGFQVVRGNLCVHGFTLGAKIDF